MALYFVTYDLRKTRNYQPLYDEMSRINAVRVLESVWAFAMDGVSAASLRDHFTNFIDSDDGLLVIKASEWASRHLDRNPPTPTNWA